MGSRRVSSVATVAVVALVLLVVLLAGWAASGGPEPVLTGDGPSFGESPRLPESATASTSETPSPRPRRPEARDSAHTGALADIVGALWRAAFVLALLWVAVRLGRPVREWWQERRRREPTLPEPEFDLVEGPRQVRAAMVDDAERQRALLLSAGSPRNAVVACWHRFEAQAERAGLARRPWETSSEFTLRVLDLVSADSAAVSRLAALYREARFSDHAMDEQARTAALAALDAIHAGLVAGVSGR